MGEEINNMMKPAMAVLILGVLVLVGMTITAGYSKVLRTETTINASNVSMVTNVSDVGVSVGINPAYPFPQALTGCVNGTGGYDPFDTLNQLADGAFVVSEGSTATGGSFTLKASGSDFFNTTLNCSVLTYLADSDNQRRADTFTAGIAIFGTFIAIIVLSLIGKLIIGVFKPNKGKGFA